MIARHLDNVIEENIRTPILSVIHSHNTDLHTFIQHQKLLLQFNEELKSNGAVVVLHH